MTRYYNRATRLVSLEAIRSGGARIRRVEDRSGREAASKAKYPRGRASELGECKVREKEQRLLAAADQNKEGTARVVVVGGTVADGCA